MGAFEDCLWHCVNNHKLQIFKLLVYTVIFSYYNSKNGVQILGTKNNSENVVIFTPYVGCLYSFWS